ncbi:Pro-Pol polyprotein [Thelohanellus kitauei]|uniref:Pro-Pol polyprotein n=1 Tax=Thelohanellus kitauei TaxID=669202 RepID=A0A0C2MXT1_THEKT|nr:Pro-Pol polyprotein [Thelohanellus kitauei]
MVLWNDKIIIPASLRDNTLNHLHLGHPGMEAMLSNARYYVWWPGLKRDIEKWVRRCYECQSHQPQLPETPLVQVPLVDSPWEKINLDFSGPIHCKWWLVILDAHSKWIECFILREANTISTTNKLNELFARCGIPKILVTDYGPRFTSKEFANFCRMYNISHVRTTPYHSRSNGAAERAIRSIKDKFKKMDNTNDDQDKMNLILYTYRN